jgi:uncharacterized protein YaaN involved in tellurite resistance
MSTVIESNEKNTELVPVVVEVKPAVVPDGLTEKQAKEFNEMADKSVTALIRAKGDIFSDEADSIINVGLKDQKEISNNIQIMQEKLGSIFYNKEKSTIAENMSKDITGLQTALAKVSPKYIQREGRYQILRRIPILGNYIVNVLQESTNRGMSLKNFVDDISESIKQSETNIRQDNATLKVINEDLKNKSLITASNAYYAELLWNKISEHIKSIEDVNVKNNLNEILARVTSRLQNIRTSENVIQQFISSIKMHRNNNDYLLDSAREIQSNGIMVVNVSMILHAALIRSKNVKDLLTGIGDFEGKMLVSNAKLLNNMVDEIAEIRKNPFIGLKYQEESVALLEEAIDKTNKMNSEVIETGKANSEKIKIWTEDLKTKSGELPNTEIKSLEASKILMLTDGK